jgi:hypothetical protein
MRSERGRAGRVGGNIGAALQGQRKQRPVLGKDINALRTSHVGVETEN